MTEPAPQLTETEIAAALEAIRGQLAALGASTPMSALAGELVAIKDTLRRLAGDNAELRSSLGAELGLRIDDAPGDDA